MPSEAVIKLHWAIAWRHAMSFHPWAIPHAILLTLSEAEVLTEGTITDVMQVTRCIASLCWQCVCTGSDRVASELGLHLMVKLCERTLAAPLIFQGHRMVMPHLGEFMTSVHTSFLAPFTKLRIGAHEDADD